MGGAEATGSHGDSRTRPSSVYLAPVALNLGAGEQVVFEGHPSWRAILGFYIKGILVVGVIAALIALIFGTGTDAVLITLHRRRRRRRRRPDRLPAPLVDPLHDHDAPAQHQARDHLPRRPGDEDRAGPGRQLPAVPLPADHADRRRRLRHGRPGQQRRLRLRRGREPRTGRRPRPSRDRAGRPAAGDPSSRLSPATPPGCRRAGRKSPLRSAGLESRHRGPPQSRDPRALQAGRRARAPRHGRCAPR